MKKLLCFLVVWCLLFTAACGKSGYNTEETAVKLEKIEFTEEYFKGKKVAVYGDSITVGAGTSGTSYTWIYKMSRALGFMYADFAVNGAYLTYANAVRAGRGSGADYIVKNAATNAECDYAFIFYGANDFSGRVSPDTPSEEPKTLSEVESFEQGIKWAVKNLKEQNPDIKIIFFTPIYRDDIPVNADGIKISVYGDKIIQLSKTLGFYYMDLGGVFNEKNFGEDSVYSGDRLHPNDIGQQKLYGFIMANDIKYDGFTENKADNEVLAFDEKHFGGKKAVIYGDSITAGTGTSGLKYAWPEKLKEKFGLEYTNVAVPGAMLTYTNAIRDGRGSCADYVLNNVALNAEVDYAFLFFGANDFTHDVPVSEPSEDPATKNDVYSFRQGITWAVKNLRAQNPDIKIIFFTPLYRDDVSVNRQGLKISVFGEEIKALSNSLDYYYVDLIGLFSSKNLGSGSIYSADRLHPNDIGQQFLFDYIINQEIIHG